jgi:hypothetical protein
LSYDVVTVPHTQLVAAVPAGWPALRLGVLVVLGIKRQRVDEGDVFHQDAAKGPEAVHRKTMPRIVKIIVPIVWTSVEIAPGLTIATRLMTKPMTRVQKVFDVQNG